MSEHKPDETWQLRSVHDSPRWYASCVCGRQFGPTATAASATKRRDAHIRAKLAEVEADS